MRGDENIDSPQSRQRLLHELRTHQVELEMQNEELRRTEDRLRATARRYTDLYNFAPVGYLTLLSRGVISDVNLRASSYLGTPRAGLIGKLFSDFVVPRHLALFKQHLKDVLATPQVVTCAVDIRNADGEIIEAEIESIQSRDELDECICIRSILRDVSHRNQIEREIIAARDKAEAASRAKSGFLSNMSHEMRTPLGVILGFAELMKNSLESKADLSHGLETIDRNGKHLLCLIDDLLDLSKIEADEMTLEYLDFELVRELQTLMEQFSPSIHAKGIELNLRFHDSMPTHILTDPVRFRQILLNLISNAIKFTEQGFVSVDVSFGDSLSGDRENRLLIIDISDSGCGITPQQAEGLFKPFAQADNSTTRRYGGTGLGLALARQLARKLGGDIFLLSSEYGKGTTFRVSIDPRLKELSPTSGALEPAKSKEVHENLDGLKVLVVEDGHDNRFILTKLLENAGAEVVGVENGIEGLESVRSTTYDAIIMDIQLPIMDGYQTTNELRRGGYTSPIIAVSAQAMVEDQANFREAGFDAYFSKPVNWGLLSKAIGHCCRGRILH